MLKVVKVLGAALLSMGLLAACSEQTVTKEDASPEVQKKVEGNAAAANSEETNETPVKNEKEDAEAAKAKAGDTLNVDGVKITVVDIKKYDGRINEYEPLKEDHAVKISVIVENTTKESAFIDSTEFKLFDIDGFELSDALPGDDTALSGDIPAGKKIKGELFFDTPKQQGTWELHYESFASIDGQSAIWEMDAK